MIYEPVRHAIPWWEVARGGGPVTKIVAFQQRMAHLYERKLEFLVLDGELAEMSTRSLADQAKRRRWRELSTEFHRLVIEG